MTSDKFKAKWLSVFAKKTNKEQIENYIVQNGNLLWHAFSFDIVSNYYRAEAARANWILYHIRFSHSGVSRTTVRCYIFYYQFLFDWKLYEQYNIKINEAYSISGEY